MYQVARIDTSTGLYIEPIVLEDGETLTEQVTNADGTVTTQPRADIISAPVPEGFHHPKWDGSEWVEGKTDAELLPIVQGLKITELRATFAAALAGGFHSSADGTDRVYGFTPSDHTFSDQTNIEQQTAAMNSGIATWPVDWADINGNPVTLDQTQFTQLDKDAQTFKWTQTNNLRAKIGSVRTATSPADVQAITY